MRTVEKIRTLLAEGATVECVENTYIPAHNGTLRRITKAGATVLECAVLTGEKAGYTGFRMPLPLARDVIALDDRQATWRIGRGDHTVTLRRVA